MARRTTIYSIGHSLRTLDVFGGLLANHGIAVLVDVRRFPTSKLAWFKKESLESWASGAGIEYVHLRELGGYRRGGYQQWMRSAEWRAGYEKLKKIALEKTTCFMCAERLPFRCHRRWLARALAREGWHVVHIINGKVYVES